MIPAPFRVVLDANVLFPFTLRDMLLRAAEQELYLPGWSAEILEEMRRNLVLQGRTTNEKSHSLVKAMRAAFPEAEIANHQHLTPSMPNNEGDRHVAAAAVHGGAQLIVTNNIKHFYHLPEGVEAKTADAFLCDLYDLSPDGMAEAVARQAQALKNPPRSLDEVLAALAKSTPVFARLLRGQT